LYILIFGYHRISIYDKIKEKNMNQNKRLQELTFKDNFMFGAVMLDPENCKGILERSLDVEIERVEVSNIIVR